MSKQSSTQKNVYTDILQYFKMCIIPGVKSTIMTLQGTWEIATFAR